MIRLPGLALLLLIGASPFTALAQQPGMGFSGPLPSDPARDQQLALPGLEPLRAQLVSLHRAVLASELPGRIATLTRREGEQFEAGDTLIRLDCTLHQARLEKAEGQLEEARAIYQVNSDLDRFGSVSQLDLKVSAARVVAAEADVNLSSELVRRCDITAPFSGKVVDVLAEPFEYVAEGQELIVVLDHEQLGIELIVPSSWLAWLRAGHEFKLHIDELDESFPAEVTRIAPQVDPVSQSAKVFAVLQDQRPELVSGMSGSARFDR